MVAFVVSSCGTAPANLQPSSTASESPGSSSPPTTATTVSPGTSPSEATAPSRGPCVEARPIADTSVALLRWETGDWRPIAGGKVSGSEAVALLNGFTGDFAARAQTLSTLSPIDPELSQIAARHHELLAALLELYEVLRQEYSQGATDPLADMEQDMGNIAVMFETSVVGLIEWLEANCPDLASEVDAELNRLEG